MTDSEAEKDFACRGLREDVHKEPSSRTASGNPNGLPRWAARFLLRPPIAAERKWPPASSPPSFRKVISMSGELYCPEIQAMTEEEWEREQERLRKLEEERVIDFR